RTLLLNIIATLYLNWSLDAYRNTLSEQAMRCAEEYVLGELFGRVCEVMPQADSLRLVLIESKSQIESFSPC
ncbi:MAG: hypothetical protein M3347_07010, partial [Armatimonadota bacterium]|nr:hypothetical protein [Armatimonadota bacterium]